MKTIFAEQGHLLKLTLRITDFVSKTEIMSFLPNPIVPWPEKIKLSPSISGNIPRDAILCCFSWFRAKYKTSCNTLPFVTERKMLGHTTKKAFDRMSEGFLGPHCR